MIASRQDYRRYVRADIAGGVPAYMFSPTGALEQGVFPNTLIHG